MSYADYLTRRLLLNIPVLVGISILIFTISRVIPGDPVSLALGPDATQVQVQHIRHQMGLDKPLYVQYFDWIGGLFRGDWGVSLRTDNNVLHDVISRFPATLELVIVAMIFAIVLAIPLGVIAGVNKDDLPDHLSRLLALFGVSMPRFWVAVLLQILFVSWLGWLPLTGRLSDSVTPPAAVTHFYLIDSLIAGQWHTFVDAAVHILLPAFALGLATLAQIMRLIRSSVIDNQRQDYVLAEKAYGLPQNLIEYKYILKNSFTSALTVIGLEFGFLIGNAFLVEIVFAWPGMARYGVKAILFQDFNAIVGVTIIVGLAFVTANLIVDLMYGLFDPRVRFGGD